MNGPGAEGRPNRITGFCSWECKPCITPLEWGESGPMPRRLTWDPSKAYRRQHITCPWLPPLSHLWVHMEFTQVDIWSLPLCSSLLSYLFCSLFIPAPSSRSVVPHAFWHPGLVLWKTIFPRGGGRWGVGGPGGTGSDGERQMKLSLPATHLLLSRPGAGGPRSRFKYCAGGAGPNL